MTTRSIAIGFALLLLEATAAVAAHVPRGEQVELLPATARVVTSAGRLYYYDDGDFYRLVADGYVVVAPPTGTAVGELPVDYEDVWVEGGRFAYSNGVFYRDGPLDTFVVADAPVGAVVRTLPVGSTAYYSDEQLLFALDGVVYERKPGRRRDAFRVVESVTAGDALAPNAGCRSLGITGRFMDAATTWTVLGNDHGSGVLIEAIEPGSPADRAGLVGGTHIVQVAGERVTLGGDLLVALELPGLCRDECLMDAPRYLAQRRDAFVAVLVRDGELARTTIQCVD